MAQECDNQWVDAYNNRMTISLLKTDACLLPSPFHPSQQTGHGISAFKNAGIKKIFHANQYGHVKKAKKIGHDVIDQHSQ